MHPKKAELLTILRESSRSYNAALGHLIGLMTHRAGLALGALTMAVSGCAGRFVEASPTGAVVKSARLGWYTKKVVAKRAPETLLAEDGTICRVAPDRFSSTSTGAAVYCNWQ